MVPDYALGHIELQDKCLLLYFAYFDAARLYAAEAYGYLANNETHRVGQCLAVAAAHADEADEILMKE